MSTEHFVESSDEENYTDETAMMLVVLVDADAKNVFYRLYHGVRFFDDYILKKDSLGRMEFSGYQKCTCRRKQHL